MENPSMDDSGIDNPGMDELSTDDLAVNFAGCVRTAAVFRESARRFRKVAEKCGRAANELDDYQSESVRLRAVTLMPSVWFECLIAELRFRWAKWRGDALRAWCEERAAYNDELEKAALAQAIMVEKEMIAREEKAAPEAGPSNSPGENL